MFCAGRLCGCCHHSLQPKGLSLLVSPTVLTAAATKTLTQPAETSDRQRGGGRGMPFCMTVTPGTPKTNNNLVRPAVSEYIPVLTQEYFQL